MNLADIPEQEKVEFIRQFFGQISDALAAEDLEPYVRQRIMNRLTYGDPEGPVRHMYIVDGLTDAQKTIDDAIIKSKESQVNVHWHPARETCRPSYRHETYLNGEKKEV